MQSAPLAARPAIFTHTTTTQKYTIMGLMDYIKSQLIEIIEWTDDSRDTLSYRWPDEDKEI